MSDIEKAIIGMQGLKEVLPPLLLKINYEGLGKEDALELSEHLDLAIQSLREKAGRDKGCEYCINPSTYLAVCQNYEERIFIGVSGSYLQIFDEEYPGFCDNHKINYCPMCGRKLEVRNEND